MKNIQTSKSDERIHFVDPADDEPMMAAETICGLDSTCVDNFTFRQDRVTCADCLKSLRSKERAT